MNSESEDDFYDIKKGTVTYKCDEINEDILTEETYINHSGKDISKEMQPIPNSCCANNCYKLISEEEISKLFKQFYQMETKNEQDQYLLGLMELIAVKQRRPRSFVPDEKRKPKGTSVCYFLLNSGNRQKVCKSTFMSTFQITKKQVERLRNLLREEKATIDLRASQSSKPDDVMDEEDARGHSGEDEEEEAESGVDSLEELQKRRSIQSGRGVTLSMLMSDGILEAGEGFLTIDYLGAKFVGDLLPGGKIRAQETQKIFSSPSSWAIHCKKLLNPDKKSGCGWSSMRYKGKKLDTYKNLWFRKHKQQEQESNNAQSPSTSGVTNKGTSHNDHADDDKKNTTLKKWDLDKMQSMIPRPRPTPQKRIIVPHSVLGNRSFAHDLNTLVKCTPFSGLDRIQPFTVTIATNCLLLVDFHCHIIKNEVVGYLGGNWDIASHNLAVLQAFPCRSGLGDKDSAARVEDEIRRSLERRHLSVVGWYHSHPTFPAQPTIKDVDSQMEYQITMKGDSDSSYTPCLGLICSPYDPQRPSMEADYLAYWVMPPPEHRPHEYGRPMQMIYSIAHDSFLTQDLLMEMRLISEYYRSTGEALDFNSELSSQAGGSHWEKLQTSLRTKLPRDLMVTGAQSTAQAQAVTHFWDFLKESLLRASY